MCLRFEVSKLKSNLAAVTDVSSFLQVILVDDFCRLSYFDYFFSGIDLKY